MSIKSSATVRDGSFVKFLVGGVILLMLTGGGIYLIKKSRMAADQDISEVLVSQVAYDNSDGSKDQNKAITTVEDKTDGFGDAGGGGTMFPPNDVKAAHNDGITSSKSLPRTGMIDTLPHVLAIGSTVYGIVYFISNKRR